MALAVDRGVASDPRIRQRLAWCYSKVQIMRYSGMRVLTQFLAGHHPGPEAAISKLSWSEYHKVVTELALEIIGAEALVPTGRRPSTAFQTDDAGAPNSTNSWVTTFLNARAGTIYAGSSQVQRNIIGEMVLGLPSEPRRRAADAGCRRAPASAVDHRLAASPAHGSDRLVAPPAVPARAVA
jgi:alkylation response protein AidB-like acyl-CoA dehydrogenase